MTFTNLEDALKQIHKNMAKEEEEKAPKKVTDIDAASDNIVSAVTAFIERWTPWPRFDIGVEVMDVGRLRDAMGLRASIDIGDPWPAAEKHLLDANFCWHWLGGQRVMFLKEKDGYAPDTGWEEAEEYDEDSE